MDPPYGEGETVLLEEEILPDLQRFVVRIAGLYTKILSEKEFIHPYQLSYGLMHAPIVRPALA